MCSANSRVFYAYYLFISFFNLYVHDDFAQINSSL